MRFSDSVEEMIKNALTRLDQSEQYERRYEAHAEGMLLEEEHAYFLDDFTLDFPHIAQELLSQPHPIVIAYGWIMLCFIIDRDYYEVGRPRHRSAFDAWNVHHKQHDGSEGSLSVFDRLGAEQGLFTLIGVNRRAAMPRLPMMDLATFAERVDEWADYNGIHPAIAYRSNRHDKRIPYIGGYWRDLDFANKHILIADCGEFIGVMVKDKWSFPQRQMTQQEIDTFISHLERVFAAIDTLPDPSVPSVDIEMLFDELWDWFQTLEIGDLS
jgi:hypothetical protein